MKAGYTHRTCSYIIRLILKQRIVKTILLHCINSPLLLIDGNHNESFFI